MLLHADREDSDQAGRTGHFVGFVAHFTKRYNNKSEIAQYWVVLSVQA